MSLPEAHNVSLAGQVENLLREMNFNNAKFDLVPLSGGANNQVYRVDFAGREPLVLKRYFSSPEDRRDRFHAEKSFYDFIAAVDLQGHTPRALAWDRPNRLGLFSWIEGRRLAASEVAPDAVEQALTFYLALNARRSLADTSGMPDASEACFDLQDHFGCVERRLARLAAIGTDSAPDREAAAFVSRQLKPAYEEYARQHPAIREEGNGPLSPERRCLSPSDFGFHNALVQAGGRIAFFDFEYAGWDDPAKFLCDFLCQPAVPVPEAMASRCIELLCRPVPGGTELNRIALLLPLHRLKWCCILLNEFLPREQSRRVFSLKYTPAELEIRKTEQLTKARKLLENFRANPLA